MWPCHVLSVLGIGWAVCGFRWVSRSPQADLKAGPGNLRIPLLPHHGKASRSMETADTHRVKWQEAQILGGHFGRTPTADSK